MEASLSKDPELWGWYSAYDLLLISSLWHVVLFILYYCLLPLHSAQGLQKGKREGMRLAHPRVLSAPSSSNDSCSLISALGATQRPSFFLLLFIAAQPTVSSLPFTHFFCRICWVAAPGCAGHIVGTLKCLLDGMTTCETAKFLSKATC